MNGDDIARYNYVLSKLSNLGLKIETQGANICLMSINGKIIYGAFGNMYQLEQYLYGYETGKSEGKNGIDNS